jgi:drug/metabolite transporter (DMT)-like permease
VAAVVFACLSAAAFGALSVVLRIALRRGSDAEVGALVTSFVALLVTIVVAGASVPSRDELRPADLWPFLIAGVLAPGLSQLFFIQAVRDLGASRTSVVVGTAPLVSVVIAVLALDEPLRTPLLVGGALIVGGSLALGQERERPAGFGRVGVALALASTVMFSTRDNFLRWLAVDTKVPPLTSAAVAMAGGAVTLLAYLVGRRLVTWESVRRGGRRFVLAGLLFGSSYSMLFEAYYHGRVTVVSPLVATESLFGVLFAALLLRRSELISRHLVAGAVLIVAGGVLIGAAR